MCIVEDVGTELFINIGEGTETSDSLVEHLDGSGNAFLISEYKVEINSIVILMLELF